MLAKFKNINGPYATLPKWIEVFERDVSINFETIRANMKDLEAKLVASQKNIAQTMFDDIRALQKKEQNDMNTQFNEKIDAIMAEMKDGLQVLTAKQSDNDSDLTDRLKQMREENQALKD